jgi:Domain of Unknown Function (DUF1080)
MNMRRRAALMVLVLAGIGLGDQPLAAADKPTQSSSQPDQQFRPADGWRPLFNGKDTSGWHFRNPRAKRVWVVCDDVRIDSSNPARLLPVGMGGSATSALLCGGDGRGSDIMTDETFQDYQLHIEFTVPKGSNSGVYNRGLFEIQVFDSFGKPKLDFHDCGALYERASPPENLSRAPGEWQAFDITLKAKKISLVWNGKPVYQDYDMRYGETDRDAYERLTRENAGKPEALRVKLREENGKYVGYFGEGGTRASLDGADRPGPILLQGDHGPVAYRKIMIRGL